MNKKLEPQHKHVMKLIARDCGPDGWANVSEQLFPILSKNMPKELVEFSETDAGFKARLTVEGRGVLKAMEWF